MCQEYVGTITKSSDCFEYPKKSLRKSSHLKNTFQNFPTQKNPSIIPATWNLEYLPPPHPLGYVHAASQNKIE